MRASVCGRPEGLAGPRNREAIGGAVPVEHDTTAPVCGSITPRLPIGKIGDPSGIRTFPARFDANRGTTRTCIDCRGVPGRLGRIGSFHLHRRVPPREAKFRGVVATTWQRNRRPYFSPGDRSRDNIDTDGKVVTLSGTVESATERAKAVALAGR